MPAMRILRGVGWVPRRHYSRGRPALPIGRARGRPIGCGRCMTSAKTGWVRRPRVNLPLDREKPVPLARQIQAQLERLIRERLLAPGTKLPATRELARTLGVNRATVALAYEELCAAGVARAHVG